MSEPLNTGSVKFFLSFTGNDKSEIAEPIGFDATIFSLIQDDNRLGRDVFFSENEFSFNNDVEINGLTHEFDRLIASYKKIGFESAVFFILQIDGQSFVIGELDFVTAKTDLFTYFRCKIIQETAQVQIKRREKVSVDVFSDRDLDDNFITPITPSQMLLQALPENQESKWDINEPYSLAIVGFAHNVYHNPAIVTVKSQIEDTLSPEKSSVTTPEFMGIINASNTLSNINININNVNLRLFLARGTGLELELKVRIGLEWDDENVREFILFSDVLNTEGTTILIENGNYSLTGVSAFRDEKIFLYWNTDIEEGGQGQIENYGLNIDSMDVSVDAISLSISSTATVVRFIDAFRQVASSIGGYNVIAPRFDAKGEYYDQWITTGKLLRQITDDGFDISLKQLLGQLPEINADYQIIDSNTIFLGIYRDFFTDNEMGSFTTPPNAVYSEGFSDLYAVNKLELKFKNYEKENDEDKSRQSVHTEMDVLLPNKSVENTKQVNIEFARDGFLIEKIRKDAIKVTEETATRDDNDILILESVNKSLSFTESMAVNQVKIGLGGQLLGLVNDNSFNWELLGMTELGVNPTPDVVTITGENAGSWIVVDFTPNTLKLSALSSLVPIVEVLEVIQFSYDVTSTTLTQRIGDGFIDVGDIFLTNGAWSNKRIVRNYWAEYIRAASMFRAGKKFLVTRYIHNNTWKSAEPNQFIVTEGDNFTQTTLTDPIVTPFEVETEVISDFSMFWQLLEDSKNVRGYISIKTNEGNVIKVFPNSLSYDWAANLIMIKGLKKI